MLNLNGVNHRRLTVLKMMTLALDELATKGNVITDEEDVTRLTLNYGKGLNIEDWELTPFFNHDVVTAVKTPY
jgi:hypothetical protein